MEVVQGKERTKGEDNIYSHLNILLFTMLLFCLYQLTLKQPVEKIFENTHQNQAARWEIVSLVLDTSQNFSTQKAN